MKGNNLTAANVNKAPSEVILEREIREYFALIAQVMSFRREKSLTTKQFSDLANLEESKIKALESGDYLPSNLEIVAIKRALT